MYSRGNPRPPCGKSWVRIITAVPVDRQSRWVRRHHYASVLKNNVQMHEMTCCTWPIAVPYFHKPTT